MATIRELRALLFHLKDQSMTVEELRAMLFNVEEQDKELDPSFSVWLQVEADYQRSLSAGGELPIVETKEERPRFCNRCGEKLDPNKIVWLELDQDTGLYTDGDLPEGHTSQGGFSFGRACAKAVLANGGRNKRITKYIR